MQSDDNLLKAFLNDGLVERRKGVMGDNPDVDDIRFFKDHPDRKSHIRNPSKVPMMDKQRAVRYLDECELQFRSLGGHDPERRRILLIRVDHAGNLLPGNRILKIPFIAFADETIEDTDAVLLPIIQEIMMGQL